MAWLEKGPTASDLLSEMPARFSHALDQDRRAEKDRRTAAPVMIGVDPRKASHTAVAIDAAETPVGTVRVRASADQAGKLVEWAADWPDRPWAVEGAGGLRSPGITDCPLTAITVTRGDGRHDADVRNPPLGAAIRWEPSSVVGAHIRLFCRLAAWRRRR